MDNKGVKCDVCECRFNAGCNKCIGGVYSRAQRLFYDSMMTVLKKEALPQSLDACKIVPAELGEKIGDVAALSAAALALP